MPLKMHEIRELIRLMDETSIEEFELDNDGTKLVMKKALREEGPAASPVSPAPVQHVAPPASPIQPTIPPATAPAVQPVPQNVQTEATEEDSDLHAIESPMVGTFYAAPSPDSDPYVKKGDQVNEKTVVCIVEAMKLMNEIEAEVRGEIVKILVENGQLVEYGQPLFLVKAD